MRARWNDRGIVEVSLHGPPTPHLAFWFCVRGTVDTSTNLKLLDGLCSPSLAAGTPGVWNQVGASGSFDLTMAGPPPVIGLVSQASRRTHALDVVAVSAELNGSPPVVFGIAPLQVA